MVPFSPIDLASSSITRVAAGCIVGAVIGEAACSAGVGVEADHRDAGANGGIDRTRECSSFAARDGNTLHTRRRSVPPRLAPASAHLRRRASASRS